MFCKILAKDTHSSGIFSLYLEKKLIFALGGIGCDNMTCLVVAFKWRTTTTTTDKIISLSWEESS